MEQGPHSRLVNACVVHVSVYAEPILGKSDLRDEIYELSEGEGT